MRRSHLRAEFVVVARLRHLADVWRVPEGLTFGISLMSKCVAAFTNRVTCRYSRRRGVRPRAGSDFSGAFEMEVKFVVTPFGVARELGEQPVEVFDLVGEVPREGANSGLALAIEVVAQPLDPAGFVSKRAVELGFKGGIEHRLEFWSGLTTERDEVAAEHQRLRRGIGERERMGFRHEFVDAGVGFGRGEGRATIAVRTHDSGEFIDGCRCEPSCEPAHARVGKPRLAVVMREMVHDECADRSIEFAQGADAAEVVDSDRLVGRNWVQYLSVRPLWLPQSAP